MTTSTTARDVITFSLDPVPPFRLDLTVWTLRRRADNAVDRWDGQTYRRVLALDDGAVAVAVTQTGAPDAPHLRATLAGAHLTLQVEAAARATLQRMLGLGVDLAAFYRFAEADAQLGPLVERFRGMKPPRLPSVFETVANAVACQQITLTQGIRLLNRLAATYGPEAPAATGDDPAVHVVAHAFPRPQNLAGLEPEDLKGLGFSTQKGRALVALAGAISRGELDVEGLAELDDDAAMAQLLALRGVGRWTAEYVLLRGLGRTYVFPGDDVGARNNLARWLHLPTPLDYVGVAKVLAVWHPYGGLIYFHLLLDRLAQAGYLGDAIRGPE